MTKKITSSIWDASAEASVPRSRRSPKVSVRGGVCKKAAAVEASGPETLAFLLQQHGQGVFAVTTPALPPKIQPAASDPLLITVPEGHLPVGGAYLLDSPPAIAALPALGTGAGPTRRPSVALKGAGGPVPPMPTGVQDFSALLDFLVPEVDPSTVQAVRPHAPPRTPLVPNITSITPGGAAWWKVSAKDPQPLHDVYLAPDQFHRHHPATLPDGPFTVQLREAAHSGRAAVVDVLLRAKGRQVANFTATFNTLGEPTLEQTEAVNDAQLALLMFRAHAVVHALVGAASIRDKVRTLHNLKMTYPDLLPAIRMMGLNLLHIACTMQLAAKDRFVLVRYLKEAGLDAAGTSDTGLTPLHCLAAQADGVFSMPLLMGWEGAVPVDINARNAAFETPLYIAYATQPHNAGLIAWLRQRGATVLMRTIRRDTMLHAVIRHGDHPEVVRDLLASGLGPGNVDEAGQNAVTLVRQLPRSASWQAVANAVRERSRYPVARQRLGTTESSAVPPPGPMIVPV